jgi:type IV pilus assembly protein PilX
MTRRQPSLRPPAGRQRGFMVIVVLVALVAMLVGGLALFRSMESNQTVAGNLAFRSSTTASADEAVAQAVAYLVGTAGTATLDSNQTASGYFASSASPGSWDDPDTWDDCATCRIPATGTDAAGNQSFWMINRMCVAVGSTEAIGNSCSRDTTAASEGTDKGAGGDPFAGTPVFTYRITVRVVGPRNSTSLLQTYVQF